MEFALTLLAAVAGGLGGWWARARLAGGAFRYDDDPPPRPARWLPPVTSATAGVTAYGLSDWPLSVVLTGVLAVIVGLALAAIDLEVHRLPRAITWPAYPALLGLTTLNSWAIDSWQPLQRAAMVGATLWAAYHLLHLIALRRGLGRGDVTLAGLIGILLGWFGWPPALVATYLTFVIAGVYAAALLVRRRAARNTRIAFGPFMIGAALLLLPFQ
ncbi:MAG: A24 family peptidase [Actinobacteria bacterium]|uniref:Prepilin type IV endopeptidase peptidase domain-containing protein n=1 Tax=Nostocoides veronense TaxID=330836 RepID=A0ABN2LY64_9MICO|nr:A24 family peptidase [Actinomycetota bacterium]